jgi:aspartyl-tRNA(Asn)/glutamyl-tRNA(Gln) amidotransferase subunit A
VRELEMRTLDDTITASNIICLAEAAVYHEPHLRDNPDGFGPKVRKRLEGFNAFSAVEFVKAERTRQRCIEEFNGVFEQVDCIVAPALPALPPRVGEETMQNGARTDTVLNTMVRFNAPQNMAGIPALVLPCGHANGFPVGLQLIAAQNREDVLLQLGAHWQRISDWHKQRPPLATQPVQGALRH